MLLTSKKYCFAFSRDYDLTMCRLQNRHPEPMFQELRAQGHLLSQQQLEEPLYAKYIVLLGPLPPSHQDDS